MAYSSVLKGLMGASVSSRNFPQTNKFSFSEMAAKKSFAKILVILSGIEINVGFMMTFCSVYIESCFLSLLPTQFTYPFLVNNNVEETPAAIIFTLAKVPLVGVKTTSSIAFTASFPYLLPP